MSELLIFRFVANEGPGYLQDFLEHKNIGHRIVAIDAGEPVPESIDSVAGLVFMGGPMSVNDPLPWIPHTLALIRHAQSRNLPMLGHCLGGQLLAKALGANVGANVKREIGWFNIERLSAPVPDRYAQLPQQFCAFHWHGETFALPEGSTPLYRSAACDNQAFALGNTLALQFHVEMQAAMIHDWAHAYRDELKDDSDAVQDPAEFTADLSLRVAQLNRVADQIYSSWLNLDGQE